ncbi:MAG: adenosylcobinamide-GDP ribazoletransferase [Nitrospinales bacterium]
MKDFLKTYAVAFKSLSFLSAALPIQASEKEYARSAAFFPIAGLFLGTILSLSRRMLARVLPEDIVDFLVIVLLAVFSGGQGLKGLAVVIERYGRGRVEAGSTVPAGDVSLKAEIAFGLILMQLMKYYALIQIPPNSKNLAIILMPMASYWIVTLLCYLPRWFAGGKEPQGFLRLVTWRECAVASLITIVALAFFLKLKALAVIFIMILVPPVFMRILQHKTQTFSWDALGASHEVSGILFLVSIRILER